jgi:hypothetical protein
MKDSEIAALLDIGMKGWLPQHIQRTPRNLFKFLIGRLEINP